MTSGYPLRFSGPFADGSHRATTDDNRQYIVRRWLGNRGGWEVLYAPEVDGPDDHPSPANKSVRKLEGLHRYLADAKGHADRRELRRPTAHIIGDPT